MKIAYFDCFSGASGDMILGAIVDAGVKLADIRALLAKMKLPPYDITSRRVKKGAISATKVDVMPKGAHRAQSPSSVPAHSHSHGHSDIPYDRMRKIIGGSSLPGDIREKSLSILERLAGAEAKIHGTKISEVHFHEIGAVDTPVDVVGGVIGLNLLGVDRVFCSALPHSKGTVETRHGLLPLPAPAALELMKGVPVFSSPVHAELVTPTGAAILTTLAEKFGTFPNMTVEKTGYGAGSFDIPGQPNVLRLIVGESANPEESDFVWVVETNLDDVTGQVVGYAMEKLFEAGALDVFVAPIQMKKNRPAFLLTAICAPSELAAVEEVMFRETPTFGIRRHMVERTKLERRFEAVKVAGGKVRVKVGSRGGRVVTVAPEYEDCRALLKASGMPLRDAIKLAGSGNHR